MIKSTSMSSLNLPNECSGNSNMGSVKKSYTTDNCIVEKKRGFKPSDRHDPAKKQFLTHLSQQIWQKKYESTNVSKKIDLHKIFTPATDGEEIVPKNRKLYASSAFYSPTLHPTVDDQVELARRISNSLSDISNQQSRGQSMYVNRKKRSLKWVHEGCGQDTENIQITNQEEYVEEKKDNNVSHHEKVPLKYLMNPSGQIRDINSLCESLNTETGLLSPDVSADVVTALQAQKGKGAELFAKRRKVSEKWVVDESNVGAQSPSGLPDYHQNQQHPRPSTSPSILPAYTDAAKHRVQLNLHQEQLLEKYAKPVLKVVQTPWEAALNSGSASAAFVEEQKLSPYPSSPAPQMYDASQPAPQLYDASQGGIPVQTPPTITNSYSKPYSTDNNNKYQTYHHTSLQQTQHERQSSTGTNSQRELAYKPSIPQGWKAPSMSLPKEEFKQQNLLPTYWTQNEINHVQQQQITTVNEAVKYCEEFTTTDETELIDLIRNNSNTTMRSNNMLLEEMHQFVNHLVKSPELTVSPIPLSTQILYDNAVQELHKKQLQQPQRQEDNSLRETCDTNPEMEESGKIEKVNVRKQLQQYEDLHRQFTKQIEREEILQKKREAAKLKNLRTKSINIAGNNNKNYATKCNVAEDSSKSIIQKILQQRKQIDEEYVQVPLKELITNFEHQCLQTEKITTPLTPPSTSPTLINNIYLASDEETIQTNKVSRKHNEDLYMPKEIPLQSYAPPPVTSIPPSISPFSSKSPYESIQSTSYKPLSTSPLPPYIVPESAPAMISPYEGGSTFPISKPYNKQGFSSMNVNSPPPRQQYLPPQSYQTAPQNGSNNIPQVNFNPSPLPYDKLAKFENQPADVGRYITSPPSKGSHINVRNKSSTPFESSYNQPHTQSFDAYHYDATPSPSPRPLSSMQQYYGQNSSNLINPRVTSNKILNAPSYNNSARGWGCNGSASTNYSHPRSHISANKPQMVNVNSMPYSDF